MQTLIPSTEESLKALATDELSYEFLRAISRVSVGATSVHVALSHYFLQYEDLSEAAQNAVDRVYNQAQAEALCRTGLALSLRASNGDTKSADMYLHDVCGVSRDTSDSLFTASGLTVVVNGAAGQDKPADGS